MPGVPSSRGCQGCRKQKKKCVRSESGAVCVRCERLSIPCIGLGQQRYKFQDLNQQLSHNQSTLKKGPKSHSNANEAIVLAAPPFDLANSLTHLTSAFISNIDPQADIKIQLPWNFGDFLNDIPRRLGTNEALDASTELLVVAYTRFLAGDKVSTPEVLNKYVNALSAMRRCLNDPVTAYSSETLCSTMVLMICQTLPGLKGSVTTSHPIGAAQILKGRGHTGPKNDFEKKLLLSLRGPVVVHALVDSRVSMTHQEWQDLVCNDLDITTIDGQMMKCLSRLPHLMDRGRSALKTAKPNDPSLQDLLIEAHALRQESSFYLAALRERCQNLDHSIATTYPWMLDQGSMDGLRKILHAHFSRSYGMALAISLIVNCVLLALQGDDSAIRQESKQFACEVVELADVVRVYRPLGAMYMVICLAAAYVSVEEKELKQKIGAYITDYQRDIKGEGSTLYDDGLRQIQRRFKLQPCKQDGT